MVKNEFIDKLESLLSRVPEQDRKEMLYDYEEHFEIGLANGKSLAELMEELGDPHVIARDLLADYRMGKMENEKEHEPSPTNISRIIIASISLCFFNLIFIIGPAAALFATYVALWAVSLGLTVLPIAIMGSYFFGYSYETFAVNFFVSLTSLSLGVLIGIGMLYMGKFLSSVVLRYIKFNVRLIKGEKVA